MPVCIGLLRLPVPFIVISRRLKTCGATCNRLSIGDFSKNRDFHQSILFPFASTLFGFIVCELLPFWQVSFDVSDFSILKLFDSKLGKSEVLLDFFLLRFEIGKIWFTNTGRKNNLPLCIKRPIPMSPKQIVIWSSIVMLDSGESSTRHFNVSIHGMITNIIANERIM